MRRATEKNLEYRVPFRKIFFAEFANPFGCAAQIVVAQGILGKKIIRDPENPRLHKIRNADEPDPAHYKARDRCMGRRLPQLPAFAECL